MTRVRGFHINSRGYRLIKKRDHPYATKAGWVREHRLVMEAHLGRYLREDEWVHHINHIKADNRLENLKLFDNHKHHVRIDMGWELRNGMWYRECRKCHKKRSIKQFPIYPNSHNYIKVSDKCVYCIKYRRNRRLWNVPTASIH